MDMVRMGNYLAQLRKEHQLTQAELAEKLGVTNKTVSRWETGNYMPPVEILIKLSDFYGLTINEILVGRKLDDEEFKATAEENIKETLRASVFDLKEKQKYWKKKWRKEHIAATIGCVIVWIAVMLILKLLKVPTYLISAFGGFFSVAICLTMNNRMLAYVEKHIYGDK